MMLSTMTLTSQPALVAGLEAQYLDSVRANYQNSEFLLENSRAEIGALLEAGAPAAAVGDAHFIGLAEHYLNEHGVPIRPVALEDALQSLGSGEVREFPWLHTANPVLPLTESRVAASLADFRARAAQRPHLYEVKGYRTTIQWDLGGADYLYLSQQGLHLYHSGDVGKFTSRMPTVSFFANLLNLCFGEAGARLCLTAGPVDEPVYNELHRLGYHPAGLSFRQEQEEDEWKHPFLYATHDLFFHALSWSLDVAPWRRAASAVFYDVLRGTAPEAFAYPGPADMEWALDPELNRHPTILAGVLATVGGLQDKWLRAGLDRAPAIFRNFLDRFPEILPRCVDGVLPPELQELRLSLSSFLAV